MNFSIPEYPEMQFGTIYCIGRNYDAHIREMNSQRTGDPVVFIKPRSSLLFSGQQIRIPASGSEVHHEVELVLLVGKKGKNIPADQAQEYIKAISVGLDLTARDLQSQAKKNGLPWALSKGFDTFAPLGPFAEFTPEITLQNLDLEVKVNGETRQHGNTSDMIFPCNKIVNYLSKQFTLYPGDLIFTGTPEGVSPIHSGDRISATLQKNLSVLHVHVS